MSFVSTTREGLIKEPMSLNPNTRNLSRIPAESRLVFDCIILYVPFFWGRWKRSEINLLSKKKMRFCFSYIFMGGRDGGMKKKLV